MDRSSLHACLQEAKMPDSGKFFYQSILGGAIFAYGTSAPSNGTTGYAKSCIFVNTAASTNDTRVLVNSGTASSCTFESITSVGGADFGSTGMLTDIVAESTSAAGVTVDGLLIKDGGFTLTDTNVILSATTGTKIGTATSQKLAFFNATPVVQGAALTAAKPTFTIADAEGTPDEAIQAVTQTTPFGFVNAAELITLLYKVQNLHTRMGEVEARLEATGLIAAN